MVDWDSFRETTKQAHADVFDFPEVDVYNFSGGYDPATGETSEWSEDAPETVQAEPVVPDSPVTVTDESGQETEVDVDFRVRDDTGVTIHDSSEGTHRPSEIEWQGKRYVVINRYDEGNGLIRLLTVES